MDAEINALRTLVTKLVGDVERLENEKQLLESKLKLADMLLNLTRGKDETKKRSSDGRHWSEE